MRPRLTLAEQLRRLAINTRGAALAITRAIILDTARSHKYLKRVEWFVPRARGKP